MLLLNSSPLELRLALGMCSDVCSRGGDFGEALFYLLGVVRRLWGFNAVSIGW